MIDIRDMIELIKDLPETCHVAIRFVDGKGITIRLINENEHIASLNALIDFQKLSGFTIFSPEGIEL